VEPDPKTALFRGFRVPSIILRTAYRKQFYPKPMAQMESRVFEGVPFASLESDQAFGIRIMKFVQDD